MMQNIKYLSHVFMGPLFSFLGYHFQSQALFWGGFVLLMLTTALNPLLDPD